jgi:serine/threonine protein kinase
VAEVVDFVEVVREPGGSVRSIITSYLPGMTLLARLELKSARGLQLIREPEVQQATLAITRALEGVHAHGLVHCNVRPEHFVFQQQENFSSLRLTGFGSAAVLTADNVAWSEVPL